MRTKDRKLLAVALRDEIAELRATLAVDSEWAAQTSANDADDAPEQMATQAVDAALLERARKRLHALEQNQADLGKPDFGLCESCGKDIPVQRLLLVPMTRLCVNCAGLEEREKGL
jgi:RNA polymerase-binding transcription factor DksA